MTDARLWKVSLTHHVVVMASDVNEARGAALDALREIDTDPETTCPIAVYDLKDLPSKWDGGCRPYGKGDPFDRTISELLKNNP